MRFLDIVTYALGPSAIAIPQLGGLNGGLTGGLTGGLLGGGAATTAVTPKPVTTFPVPGDYTVGSAVATCGKDLSLSCCNKATTSGSAVSVASGILSGILPNVLPGSLGLFDQCGKLSVTGRMSLLCFTL